MMKTTYFSKRYSKRRVCRRYPRKKNKRKSQKLITAVVVCCVLRKVVSQDIVGGGLSFRELFQLVLSVSIQCKIGERTGEKIFIPLVIDAIRTFSVEGSSHVGLLWYRKQPSGDYCGVRVTIIIFLVPLWPFLLRSSIIMLWKIAQARKTRSISLLYHMVEVLARMYHRLNKTSYNHSAALQKASCALTKKLLFLRPWFTNRLQKDTERRLYSVEEYVKQSMTLSAV